MRVKWLEMTADQVVEMSRRTRVALLPVGSVERHGPHLPCGTDFYTADSLCEMAARIEPAIVIPGLPINIAACTMYWPGTAAARPNTVRLLYRDLCAEAARNGFDRIISVITHGGSPIVTDFYIEELNRSRAHGGVVPYQPMWMFILNPIRKTIAEVIETPGGHACEMETSLMMFLRPELVRHESVPGEAPVNLSAPLGARSGLEWTVENPEAYSGQPAKATAEKGEVLMTAAAEGLAEIIRRVKTFDPTLPATQWRHSD